MHKVLLALQEAQREVPGAPLASNTLRKARDALQPFRKRVTLSGAPSVSPTVSNDRNGLGCAWRERKSRTSLAGGVMFRPPFPVCSTQGRTRRSHITSVATCCSAFWARSVTAPSVGVGGFFRCPAPDKTWRHRARARIDTIFTYFYMELVYAHSIGTSERDIDTP